MPANDLTAHLRLTADGKGFVGEIRVSKKELDAFTGATKKGADTQRNFTRRTREVEAATRSAGRSFTDAHGRVARYFAGFAGFAVLTQATRTTIALADSYTNLNNRLRLVTDSETEQAAVRERLLEISLATRTALATNAELYSRFALAVSDTSRSQQDLLTVTELLNKQVAIGGNTATEASAGLTQFAQGLASGRLQGDELRSVLENLQGVSQGLIIGFRRLYREGRIGFEVTRGNLRDLAAEGKLSSELLLDAILASADDTNRKFRDVDITVSGALTNIATAALQAVGGLDEALGTSETLAARLNQIAEGRVDEGLGFLDEAAIAAGIVLTVRLVRSTEILTRAQQRLSAVTAGANRQALSRAQILGVWRRGADRSTASALRLARAYRTLNAAQAGLSAGVRSATALLGGVPGILLLVGFGVHELTQRWRDARQPGQDYLDLLEQIRKEESGEVAPESDPLRLQKNAVLAAERLAEEAFGELEKRRADADARIQPAVAAINAAYEGAFNSKTRAELIDRVRKHLQEEVADAEEAYRRAGSNLADARQDLVDATLAQKAEVASRATISSDVAELLSKYLPTEEQINAAADTALAQLRAERERLVKEGAASGDAAIAQIDVGIGRVNADRDAKLDAERIKRTAALTRLVAGLRSEEEQINATYREQQALVEEHAAALGVDKQALLDQIGAQRDAALTALSGADALAAVQIETARLGTQRAMSREQLDQYNAAQERELELKRSYPNASAPTLTALAAEYAQRDRLLAQQQRELDLLERFAAARQIEALQAQALSDVNNLEADGRLDPAEAEEARRAIEIEGRHATQQALLEVSRAAREQELLELQGFNSLVEQAEREHADRIIDIRSGGFSRIADAQKSALDLEQAFAEDSTLTATQKTQTALKVAEKGFGDLAKVNKKFFKFQQAAALANAVVTTAQGVADALKKGIPLGLIEGALVAAAGAAQIAAIRAQQPPQAFRRGGIIDSPEFFSFARERPVGVAGEAGPEAIIPLARARNGVLGVRQLGDGPARAPLTITVAPTVQVSVAADGDGQAIGDAAGDQIIEVMHTYLTEQMRPGGLLNG